MSGTRSKKPVVVRITVRELMAKVEELDRRLVSMWLDDEGKDADQLWENFVMLLETRVELLKTCRQAGVTIDRELCLPAWLERLVSTRQAIRLRELRQLEQKLKRRRTVLSYDKFSDGEA